MVTNGWLEPEKKDVRSLPPPLPAEADIAQRFLEEDRR